MLKKPVPHPGYSATKPCLAAFQTLFHDLGEQDACIQLQEISQRFLEATAEGMGSKVENFLQILYQAHEVPHGTYDFMKMRNVSHKSYLVLTYASFEGALNEAIDEFKARTGATWSKKDAHRRRFLRSRKLHSTFLPTQKLSRQLLSTASLSITASFESPSHTEHL
jgi:hypothetical protein